MDTINRLKEHFGTGSAAARAIGLESRQVFNNWERRGRIPPDHFPVIVEATGGAITLEELYQGNSPN